ncbi:MAG: DNA-binding protein [Deltaproteobacteria bacterium]|nr:MAG: DNA-binding protein [Deltaproteobacteria bacterium]
MKLSFLPEDKGWLCENCQIKMEPGLTELHYQGNVFKVELLLCPSCDAVLIAEDLAVGRMLEVEKLLEDK